MSRWRLGPVIFFAFVMVEERVPIDFVGLEGLRRVGFAGFIRRFGFHVFFTDHFRHRAKCFNFIAKVGDMEESGLLQADIDEGRLHPGQDPRYSPFIYIADKAATLVPLQVELGQHRVFQHRYSRLQMGRIYDDFPLHLWISPPVSRSGNPRHLHVSGIRSSRAEDGRRH